MKSIETRFFENIEKIPFHTCWEWIGNINSQGYGKLYIHDRKIAAHRIAWELKNGKIAKGSGYHGTCVLHKCDNRSCVNPDHLFLGTQEDNIQDMKAKKRCKSGSQPGEKSSSAKITNEDVIEIREKYKQGNISQKELAKEFNLHQKTISNITLKQTWKHL